MTSYPLARSCSTEMAPGARIIGFDPLTRVWVTETEPGSHSTKRRRCVTYSFRWHLAALSAAPNASPPTGEWPWQRDDLMQGSTVMR
jgi:hypothetical protein